MRKSGYAFFECNQALKESVEELENRVRVLNEMTSNISTVVETVDHGAFEESHNNRLGIGVIIKNLPEHGAVMPYEETITHPTEDFVVNGLPPKGATTPTTIYSEDSPLLNNMGIGRK